MGTRASKTNTSEKPESCVESGVWSYSARKWVTQRGSERWSRASIIRGMREPAYPAARVVASRLHAHFAKRMARSAGQENDSPAAVPDVSAIEAVIDTAFWASLRREEGYVPRISLALVSPSETTYPLLFERPLALDPGALTRVAPAVERAGIHLGVWRDRDELAVWGTTRTIPAGGFVLKVAAPGLLVVKEHHGQHTGKFINVAVLEGDQVKVVDADAGGPDGPPILTAFLTFNSAASLGDWRISCMRARRLHARPRTWWLASRRAPWPDAVARIGLYSRSRRALTVFRRAHGSQPGNTCRIGPALLARSTGSSRGGCRRFNGGRRRHGPDNGV